MLRALHGRAVSRHSPNGLCAGRLHRLFRVSVCAVAAVLVLSEAALTASAQTAPECLPPLLPRPVLDAALLAQYRNEIGQEYSAYFDAAQLYLHCLDTARTAVTADIARALAEYERLGPVADD